MSGNLPNALAGGTNPLPAQMSPQPQPSVASPQAASINHPLLLQHVRNALRGNDQATVIRRRDAAGKEMAYLSELMNDPHANSKEVERYIGSLTEAKQITPTEAFSILRSMPQSGDPADIRQWAKMMFAAVMHVGIEAHAAYPEEIFPRGSGQQPQPGQGPQPGPPPPQPGEPGGPPEDEDSGEDDEEEDDEGES